MALLNSVVALAMSIIIQFEGISLKPYPCPGGYMTIGYGHVLGDEEQGIEEITKMEAIEYLRNDCIYCYMAIEEFVTVELGENQKAALISLCFNIGVPSLRNSTLIKKLNNGEYAADEFMRWNRIKGKKISGLTNRREAERSLFLSS